MFKELVPLLRQRAVLLTVTLIENDELRVNIVPRKLADSDNNALTTPLSVTGTAEELDAQLPAAMVSYVSSHLELKHSLDRCRAEMDAAAKAAQAEARAKGKSSATRVPSRTEATSVPSAPMPVETKPEPSRAPGLFDNAAAESRVAEESEGAFASTDDEEEEILAEIAEANEDAA